MEPDHYFSALICYYVIRIFLNILEPRQRYIYLTIAPYVVFSSKTDNSCSNINTRWCLSSRRSETFQTVHKVIVPPGDILLCMTRPFMINQALVLLIVECIECRRKSAVDFKLSSEQTCKSVGRRESESTRATLSRQRRNPEYR